MNQTFYLNWNSLGQTLLYFLQTHDVPSFSSPDVSPLHFRPSSSPWRFDWPNSANQNFNFYKLFNDAKANGIASVLPEEMAGVAIVGAGITGLTLASGLFRSGFTNIDIFEPTGRMGGRDYSLPVPGRTPIERTVFEMGAMRMPFFTEPDDPNSVMGIYSDTYGIATQPFPGPGTVRTGSYTNNGYGPEPLVLLPNP